MYKRQYNSSRPGHRGGEGGLTSPLAKGPLATGRCSNDCSLPALETEINPGGSKGGLRGINGSASRKVSGLRGRRAPPPLWPDGETEDAIQGRSPGQGDMSWAVPGGSDQRSRVPASLGQMPRIWLFLTSPAFQLFQMWSFFQTKLRGGENPAFPAVSGSRLFMEGLAPRSAHRPPSKVHSSSKMDPSLLTRSDRYLSLRQPPPQKTTLKHLNAGYFCPSSHFRVKTFLSFHKLL